MLIFGERLPKDAINVTILSMKYFKRIRPLLTFQRISIFACLDNSFTLPLFFLKRPFLLSFGTPF